MLYISALYPIVVSIANCTAQLRLFAVLLHRKQYRFYMLCFFAMCLSYDIPLVQMAHQCNPWIAVNKQGLRYMLALPFFVPLKLCRLWHLSEQEICGLQFCKIKGLQARWNPWIAIQIWKDLASHSLPVLTEEQPLDCCTKLGQCEEEVECKGRHSSQCCLIGGDPDIALARNLNQILRALLLLWTALFIDLF